MECAETLVCGSCGSLIYVTGLMSLRLDQLIAL